MAQRLPIPDMPVRDLIRAMRQDPGALEDLMLQRKEVLVGEVGWTPLVVSDEVGGPAAGPGEQSRQVGRHRGVGDAWSRKFGGCGTVGRVGRCGRDRRAGGLVAGEAALQVGPAWGSVW